MKALAVLACVALLALVTALFAGAGCPVKAATGVGCPGCGLSRAAIALMQGQFARAFAYNPMIYVLPPVILFVLFGKKPLLGSKKRERILLWGTFAVWIIIYLVRLAQHSPVLFS